MKIEQSIEQQLNQIVSAMDGGSVVSHISKPISACMSAGVVSYLKLNATHRKHIDDVVAATIAFMEHLKPQIPKMMQYASNLTVENATGFIKLANKILRKKSTAALVQQYLDVYGDLIHNPKRIKAIGAYMVCLVSNLDVKYKEAVVAAIECAFTFIQMMASTNASTKIVGMSDTVYKHIVRPMYKELARKK